jgi:hypothetical protein
MSRIGYLTLKSQEYVEMEAVETVHGQLVAAGEEEVLLPV